MANLKSNAWADYWRKKVGVNVIPNDSVNKKPTVKWVEYEAAPVPLETHEKWKVDGMFDTGMALLVGRAWHLNNGNNNLFLVAIDCDNFAAVNYAKASLPFAQMAQESRGSPEKLHLYCYVSQQMENYKSADDAPVKIELHAKNHLITCTPSQYGRKEVKDGREVCIPTGNYYKLLANKFNVLQPTQLVMPAGGVKRRKAKDGLPFDFISAGGRNDGFFSVCVAFMKRFRVSEKFDNDLAWVYLWNYNLKYCKPPLEEVEARAVFESSLVYKEKDDLGTDMVIGG